MRWSQVANGRGHKQLGWGRKDQAKYEAGEDIILTTVQNVGNQTSYRRGRVWYAQNAMKVDLRRDAGSIQTVERFSEKYFKLVTKNTLDENRVLASQRSNEELVIELRGQVYRIR